MPNRFHNRAVYNSKPVHFCIKSGALSCHKRHGYFGYGFVFIQYNRRSKNGTLHAVVELSGAEIATNKKYISNDANE